MAQVIRAATVHDLAAFFAYLDDHLAANGRDGLPLQPMPRAASRFPADKQASFRTGLVTPLDAPGWRRYFASMAKTTAIRR